MNRAEPAMDVPYADALALLQAETLEQLAAEDLRIAAQALAPASVERTAWLLQPPAGAAGLLVATQTNIHRRRFYRHWQPGAELAAALQDNVPHLLSAQPVELLAADSPAEAPLSVAGRPLLIPLAPGAAPPADPERTAPTPRAWLIVLAPDDAPPERPAIERVAAIAELLAGALRRLLRAEARRSAAEQLHQIHEFMQRALVAPDRPTLLDACLSVVTRSFGLPRVAVCLMNQETRALRSELHTGFDAGFSAAALTVETQHNPLYRALRHGEPQLNEGNHNSMYPAATTERRAQAGERNDAHQLPHAQRRVIIPLHVGLKPLGVIYADQPYHDAAPIWPEPLRVFAGLAGAALENLNLRVDAEQRAETDPLTGLRNRFYLDKVLEQEIPRVQRYRHPISLLMIDLLGFKHINDTYGHQFGDFLLRETAGLIQGNVRRPDIVVRYGGDEFVVLMVNTTHAQAEQVRERIERAFIERNRLQSDEKMVINISVGLRSADADSIDDLLDKADQAMYAQKARQKRCQLIDALLSGQIDRIELADKVVGSLCNMLYKKAPYYADHALRTAHVALMLARKLALEESEVEVVMLAALLHGVGKVSLPTETLRKTETLTPGEREAMRHHPAVGEEFFEGIDHLEPLRPVIRYHHERYDGDTECEYPGYPDGLSGEHIPLGARIIKLAEAVDALSGGPPYAHARTHDQVVEILRRETGRAFDPRLVRLLLADKQWRHARGDVDAMRELFAHDEL